MKIDLWVQGRPGVEARYDDGVLYVYGSDHWLDWLHHLIPGAVRRETLAACQIIEAIEEAVLVEHVRIVAGHSWGAAIAAHVHYELAVRGVAAALFTYGGKRAAIPTAAPGRHYRHKGDIVPALPPWRPRWPNVQVFGPRMLPWHAHEPRGYYPVMEHDGVR